MIQLTHQPLQSEVLLKQVESPHAGAIVLFLGVTRQFTRERETEALEYECYPDMAEKKLQELEQEALRRWQLEHCVIVHRLGKLEIGEASVAVAVSSAHRGAAFEAGQWLIDTLKEVVPIWKRECWADGTSEWVHPGLTPTPNTPAPAVSPRSTNSPPTNAPPNPSPDSLE